MGEFIGFPSKWPEWLRWYLFWLLHALRYTTLVRFTVRLVRDLMRDASSLPEVLTGIEHLVKGTALRREWRRMRDPSSDVHSQYLMERAQVPKQLHKFTALRKKGCASWNFSEINPQRMGEALAQSVVFQDLVTEADFDKHFAGVLQEMKDAAPPGHGPYILVHTMRGATVTKEQGRNAKGWCSTHLMSSKNRNLWSALGEPTAQEFWALIFPLGHSYHDIEAGFFVCAVNDVIRHHADSRSAAALLLLRQRLAIGRPDIQKALAVSTPWKSGTDSEWFLPAQALTQVERHAMPKVLSNMVGSGSRPPAAIRFRRQGVKRSRSSAGGIDLATQAAEAMAAPQVAQPGPEGPGVALVAEGGPAAAQAEVTLFSKEWLRELRCHTRDGLDFESDPSRARCSSCHASEVKRNASRLCSALCPAVAYSTEPKVLKEQKMALQTCHALQKKGVAAPLLEKKLAWLREVFPVDAE